MEKEERIKLKFNPESMPEEWYSGISFVYQRGRQYPKAGESGNIYLPSSFLEEDYVFVPLQKYFVICNLDPAGRSYYGGSYCGRTFICHLLKDHFPSVIEKPEDFLTVTKPPILDFLSKRYCCCEPNLIEKFWIKKINASDASSIYVEKNRSYPRFVEDIEEMNEPWLKLKLGKVKNMPIDFTDYVIKTGRVAKVKYSYKEDGGVCTNNIALFAKDCVITAPQMRHRVLLDGTCCLVRAFGVVRADWEWRREESWWEGL